MSTSPLKPQHQDRGAAEEVTQQFKQFGVLNGAFTRRMYMPVCACEEFNSAHMLQQILFGRDVCCSRSCRLPSSCC
jgi:hypothetical protein